jgi:hypothetical protein
MIQGIPLFPSPLAGEGQGGGYFPAPIYFYPPWLKLATARLRLLPRKGGAEVRDEAAYQFKWK